MTDISTGAGSQQAYDSIVSRFERLKDAGKIDGELQIHRASTGWKITVTVPGEDPIAMSETEWESFALGLHLSSAANPKPDSKKPSRTGAMLHLLDALQDAEVEAAHTRAEHLVLMRGDGPALNWYAEMRQSSLRVERLFQEQRFFRKLADFYGPTTTWDDLIPKLLPLIDEARSELSRSASDTGPDTFLQAVGPILYFLEN